MPESYWNKETNDLVAPDPTERKVLIALLVTQNVIRSFMTYHKQNVDNEVSSSIIADMIRSLLIKTPRYHVGEKHPNITSIADYLSSICAHFLKFDKLLVVAFFNHYNNHGTSGFDDIGFSSGHLGLPPGTDHHFKFFLLFMDIKCAVYHWMSAGQS